MTRSERGRGRVPRHIGTVLWWAAATGLYLSFVTFTWTQVIAGGVVAAGAVALSRRGARAAGLSQQGALPYLWPPRSVMSVLIHEVRAVAGALAGRFVRGQPVGGRFIAFRSGQEIDPEMDTALTLEASLAPNTYVVAVLAEDGDAIVLTHQFSAQPDVRRSFPRWRR